jgi:hypothetical protein
MFKVADWTVASKLSVSRPLATSRSKDASDTADAVAAAARSRSAAVMAGCPTAAAIGPLDAELC